jgi:LL-diaminopimelate aminotransferase
MYLWAKVPGDESSEDYAARQLEHGELVSPGTFFGPSGEGYVRLSLVPGLDECRAACEILEDML